MVPRGVLRIVLAAALFLSLCAPSFAENAADDPAATVARAEKLILSGAPASALALLRPLAARDPGHTDAWFFRGMAALATASLPAGADGAPESEEARRALYDEAVASYRRILEERPGLAGARLELARALFERGRCLEPPDDLFEHLLGDDCDAAAHHFRRALAGDLPEPIAGAVTRFVAAVQARKRVSGSFGVALAPDSNVNAGTDARSFPSRLRNVFTGEALEFGLGEEARRTSGLGVVIAADGEYRHPLALRLLEDTATRLRLGGGLYRREYGGKRFDDMTLSVQAGPQILFPHGRASLLARADRRWLAGAPVSRGIGPRLEGRVSVGERLWLGGGVQRMERRYRAAKASDGPVLAADVDLSYALTPAVVLGARGGWQRTRAARPTLRSRTRRLGLFGGVDLPPVLGVTGFGVGASHDVFFTRYDEPGYFLISADARRDRLSITRLTASNDHLALFGFVPALSLVYERRASNIADVFDYNRQRAELTMRRRF